ncbi:homocitrate synthase [Candidatus Methylacidiphilum fumarolicum]|uniref:Homocitrate/citramalate synthase n=2 Tax=Candidatus Methylacidiphilum fumarolicum TaxID=591154 RepID=I0JYS6_METFB|nr:homocitrate synthase [Candidatus Methylacidiphilum fumarolicum]TFE69716.1 homocitrate synthase [Candidatus Methylacidiphilum fumarolicum]CAI9084915.1 Homocitrate synthase 1 [Candidatus Methylacidiphilum fumarolicum]CCG92395.1 Homocitrate/citramalate synthase [Methylacidiphilum fumariolicum SolV]
MGTSQKILLADTTLRDGEQTPGVAFSPNQKDLIAKRLAQCGLREIEAGTPSIGKVEMEAFDKILSLGLSARITAWGRMTEEDLKAVKQSGASTVNLSIPLSDIQISTKLKMTRSSVLEKIKKYVSKAKDMGLEVAMGGEDASRADEQFLMEAVEVSQQSGAFRFRYADTVGILDPIQTYKIISKLKKITPMLLEFHGHDDFGMATANSIAAWHAGVDSLSLTTCGLGERAGNGSLEEVAFFLSIREKVDCGIDLKALFSLCFLIARFSGRKIPRWKSILGKDIFLHESGIHVDGILKNPRNYEPFHPSIIGRKHRFILGKHSGRKSVLWTYEKLGIFLSEEQARRILDQIRDFAINNKRTPSKEELIGFVDTPRAFPSPSTIEKSS